MSSLNANHSLGGEPLLCNGNQEKRPLLRGEVPQPASTSVISRRDITSDGTTAIIQIPLPAPERAEPRYKPEKLKTLLAFLFASTCLVGNLFVLAYVHERVPDRSVAPLPDIFFNIFPAVDRALDVSEIIIIASVWTCILLMILHRYRWIVFRRVFIIMGSLYAMRAITMLVTQVPIASTTYFCSAKANSTSPSVILRRVLKLFTGFGLSINGQHTYCGDYIFSGHTLILTMCFLIVKEYSPQRCRILHILYFCTSCTGIFLVLLARGHYTIDVILGYYVTTRVFWIYHALCASQLSTKVSELERAGGDVRVKPATTTQAGNGNLWLRWFSHQSAPAAGQNNDPNGSVLPPDLGESTYQGAQDSLHSSTDRSSHNVSERSVTREALPDADDETHLSSQTAASYLSRVWWYPLFHYFEKNVTGPVPRQYEWPLPWPRKWLPRTRIS